MAIGNSFADGWLDPSLQKSGFAGGPHGRGEPHAALFVEHRVVHVVLARPDHFVAPVRRRLRHRRRWSAACSDRAPSAAPGSIVCVTGSSTGR